MHVSESFSVVELRLDWGYVALRSTYLTVQIARYCRTKDGRGKRSGEIHG